MILRCQFTYRRCISSSVYYANLLNERLIYAAFSLRLWLCSRPASVLLNRRRLRKTPLPGALDVFSRTRFTHSPLLLIVLSGHWNYGNLFRVSMVPLRRYHLSNVHVRLMPKYVNSLVSINVRVRRRAICYRILQNCKLWHRRDVGNTRKYWQDILLHGSLVAFCSHSIFILFMRILLNY